MEFPFAQRIERWAGRSIGYKRLKKGKTKVLFVLGHMRSGSSLLVHILSSNRGVEGYGETHIKYKDIRDLGVLMCRICRAKGKIYIQEKYILDKILHKWKIKNMDVIKSDSTKVVFILRGPKYALSSMIKNTEIVEGPSDACSRYETQIEWIEALVQKMPPKKWSYVTYKEITQTTNVAFSRLETVLELPEPLSERYKTNQYTGEAGIGDPGPHIETGYIKRDIDREIDPRIYPYLRRAKKKFQSCVQLLRSQSALHNST